MSRRISGFVVETEDGVLVFKREGLTRGVFRELIGVLKV